MQSIWSEIRSAPQILINLFLGTHRDCLLKRVRLNPESRGLQESVLAKLTVYVITDNNYLGLGFSLLQSLCCSHWSAAQFCLFPAGTLRALPYCLLTLLTAFPYSGFSKIFKCLQFLQSKLWFILAQSSEIRYGILKKDLDYFSNNGKHKSIISWK